ncbi:hypothetical protein SDC9_175400 [bioreactor metagenome]|uniref:Uncharacterized protein n=1 Tax=bioreactor metagenome TaxID=1076179 RepID=A0A645GP59_9ZZZZ
MANESLKQLFRGFRRIRKERADAPALRRGTQDAVAGYITRGVADGQSGRSGLPKPGTEKCLPMRAEVRGVIAGQCIEGDFRRGHDNFVRRGRRSVAGNAAAADMMVMPDETAFPVIFLLGQHAVESGNPFARKAAGGVPDSDAEPVAPEFGVDDVEAEEGESGSVTYC